MGIKIVNWTYTRDFTNPRDKVRLLVGDTDPEDKQLDDDEITWLLVDNGGPLNAAVAAAIGLAAIYSRKYDTATGRDSTEGGGGGRRASTTESQKSQQYLALAERLMWQRSRRGVAAFAGGQSYSAKQIQDSDNDRVRPFFKRDMNDYYAVLDDLKQYWSFF